MQAGRPRKLLVALVAALALGLLAANAQGANARCAGESDSCECGMNTPCWCCDENGNFGESCGNCVWWAWHEACCHWGRALPWCTNANTWDEFARDNGYPRGNQPHNQSIFVCNASAACSQWGHVGWVTRAFADGTFDSTEMSCGGPCGVLNRHRAAGFATGGFIYDPDGGGGPDPDNDDADFVRENVPDGTEIEAGTRFTKRWTVRNSGNTTWTRDASYLWTHDGEERFGAGEQTVLGGGERVAPGNEKEWAVDMVAPGQPGTYRGYWRMDRFGTHRFGERCWVEIRVVPGEDRDEDGDGVPASRDCDDGDPQRAPGRAESCDNKDNDCNGSVDDGLRRPCDSVCGTGQERCERGSWTGCDAPQAGPESCNSRDDDCDGATDEDLVQSCDLGCGPGQERCEGGRWAGCTAPQPGDEACNGVDDDCDGDTDEDLRRPCEGPCGAGEEACFGGRWGDCSARRPTPEECNSLDDDCDGSTDEDLLLDCETACGSGVRPCQGGAWMPCTARQPTAEACNGLDDDCNGAVDEGCTCEEGSQQFCGEDRGACVPGTQQCTDGHWSACTGGRLPTPEICNERDDDCDGYTDESLPCEGEPDSPGGADGGPDDGSGGPQADAGAGRLGMTSANGVGCGSCRSAAEADGGGAGLLGVLAALALVRARRGR